MSIQTLQKIIDKSQNIVFFGGAGVSVASGIPDFRGAQGLYNEKYKTVKQDIKAIQKELHIPDKYLVFIIYKELL